MEWYNKGQYVPVYRLSHELLEHIDKNEVGSVENEFAALGARLYVGQFFDFYPVSYSLNENGFAYDIYRNLEDGQFDSVRACPNTSKTNNHRLENIFDYCYGKLREIIDREDNFDIKAYDIDNFLADNKETIRNWLYFGYQRAAKKYSKYDTYRIYSLGQKIDSECEKLNKYNELFEGMKISVYYTLTGNVKVELIESEY